MSFCRTIMNVALLAGLGSVACAGEVSELVSFSAGTTAKASEVNGNFTAVKGAVDDNHARIQALEQTVAALQAIVDELRNSNVMALDTYLTVDEEDGPTAILSGINLQIVNGTGVTSSTNGLGNLIVGYDEPRSGGPEVCSIGEHTDETSCLENGGTWALSHKNGSHYVVIGPEHNYSQYGGLLAGASNTSNGWFASVTGGAGNTASGRMSSVSGGDTNIASGHMSSVSGGQGNTASGQNASVSGGGGSTASGPLASVSGGSGNEASGPLASVSGGLTNTASAAYASVSGGEQNTASGSASGVSGGAGNTASGSSSSVSGGVDNTAAGPISSVTGGAGNTAAHEGSTVGGGMGMSTSTNYDWTSGP